jgi:FkbM family methyltransferase
VTFWGAGRWIATRTPFLPRVVLRVWADSYLRRPRPEHWLFTTLKARLGYRYRRLARLSSGQSLYVDPFDAVGREIVRSGCYEPETVAVFQALLAPGMIVVDAGAHVGQYTVIASALVGAEGRVHAFEPDPETFRQLQANVALNRCRNVACNPVALSRDDGTATLFLSDVSNVGGNSLRPTVCYRGRRTEVRLQTLDRYAMSATLPRLDVLKADVEGAELFLLQGGVEVITRFTPTMILEFSINTKAFGYSEEDLRDQLRDWGYVLFGIGPWPLTVLAEQAGRASYYNVLAVHRRMCAALVARGVIQP